MIFSGSEKGIPERASNHEVTLRQKVPSKLPEGDPATFSALRFCGSPFPSQ